MVTPIYLLSQSLPGGSAREVSALGHELAFCALSRLSGEPVSSVRARTALIKHPGGKPAFAGSPAQLSISHTGTLAAAAVSAVDIGIDLEPLSRQSLRAAHRMFCQKELEWLCVQGEGAFARLWTLREAYAKWTGLGLAALCRREKATGIPLHFSIAPDGTATCSDKRCAAASLVIGEYALGLVLPAGVQAELIWEEYGKKTKKIWKTS